MVTALPHSAAHAVVYTLSRTTADVLPALLGCLARLGGAPEVLVVDNDPSIVATGKGRRAAAPSTPQKRRACRLAEDGRANPPDAVAEPVQLMRKMEDRQVAVDNLERLVRSGFCLLL